MDNTNVAPVDHGVLSATGNVAAGAGVGAVKSGFKGYGVGVLICAAIGASIGAFGAGFLITGAIGGALLGGAIGLVTGGPLLGGISSIFGGAHGAGRAYNQVKLEKGAANVMQAQVEAYKAEAQAQAFAAANDNKYNFPPQGSAFNQAGTTVNVVQPDGRVVGQQLQRA